jgi:hypothetical protein
MSCARASLSIRRQTALIFDGRALACWSATSSNLVHSLAAGDETGEANPMCFR